MAKHSVRVNGHRTVIIVDGKPLTIIAWPENEIALTDDGGFYTAGPNLGYAVNPCVSCGNLSCDTSEAGECHACQQGWLGGDCDEDDEDETCEACGELPISCQCSAPADATVQP